MYVSGFSLEFGADYLCRFGSVDVAASYVIVPRIGSSVVACTAPPQPDGAGAIVVYVTLNAQQYYTNSSLLFTYFTAARVDSFSPTSGPALGGTQVNESGVGFAGGSVRMGLGDFSG